ncbi:hypothetical protein [Vibrio sp. D431a]|uniref:hypothetical protein n=1 Tax=Vibrio sp. D431a TaxID=2837388 RepID=UPI002552FCB5|nr:hypothetical protein [Vibrio sp. D431a]MDK9793766.1 hypothetical protein [Vibrio sp. D431a]
MTTEFITREEKGEFIVFTAKPEKGYTTKYPTAPLQEYIDSYYSDFLGIAKESGLLEPKDSLNWLQYASSVLLTSLKNLGESNAYVGEQVACLAQLKNLEFKSYPAIMVIYDNVQNAKSAKQLIKSVNKALTFLNALALTIHQYQTELESTEG